MMLETTSSNCQIGAFSGRFLPLQRRRTVMCIESLLDQSYIDIATQLNKILPDKPA
jgi:hypothetical protein